MKTTPLLKKSRRNVKNGGIEILEARIAPAFTSVLSGLTATFTADAQGGELVITDDLTYLHHNQPVTMTSFVTSLGQTGFESSDDFDSTQPGVQFLFSSNFIAGAIVNVTSATPNATFTESRYGNFDAGSINLPGGTVSLNTLNGGTISDNEGSITAANLHLSGGPVELDNANNVTNLVANLDGSLLFSNGTNSLTVGANIVNTTGISSDGSVTLVADQLNVANSINAGKSTVTLRPSTQATLIDLGGLGSGFSLSDAELDSISAFEIVVGDQSAGDITITAPISPSNTLYLNLVTGGKIALANLQPTVISANATSVDIT